MSDQGSAIAEFDLLRQQIAAQLQRITEQQSALSEHEQRNATQQRDLRTDLLTAKGARAKRLQFGAGTEAQNALQRELFADTVTEEVAAAEQALEQAERAGVA
jgi:hypothetical protein